MATEYGDSSGIVLPVMIPKITDIADIQDGLRNFYYGTPDGDEITVVGDLLTNSIAGRLYDLDLTKLEVNAPSATSPLTITGTPPRILFTNGTYTATVEGTTLTSTYTLQLPSSSGTFALLSEPTFSLLGNIGTGSVGTITVGSSSLATLSLGTSGRTGSLTIGLGSGAVSVTKTLNIGTGSTSGTTNINIGTNVGGTSTISSYGSWTQTGTALVTGAITGSTTIQADTKFIVGSSGPTITSGSSDPSADEPRGSIFLKTGVAFTSAFWVKNATGSGTSNWRKIRGNMWFTGTVDPNTLSLSEQSDDLYLNRATGEIWQAS